MTSLLSRLNSFGGGSAIGFMFVLVLHAYEPEIVDTLPFALSLIGPLAMTLLPWLGKAPSLPWVLWGVSAGGFLGWVIVAQRFDFKRYPIVDEWGDLITTLVTAAVAIFGILVNDRRRAKDQLIELKKIDQAE